MFIVHCFKDNMLNVADTKFKDYVGWLLFFLKTIR